MPNIKKKKKTIRILLYFTWRFLIQLQTILKVTSPLYTYIQTILAYTLLIFIPHSSTAYIICIYIYISTFNRIYVCIVFTFILPSQDIFRWLFLCLYIALPFFWFICNIGIHNRGFEKRVLSTIINRFCEHTHVCVCARMCMFICT